MNKPSLKSYYKARFKAFSHLIHYNGEYYLECKWVSHRTVESVFFFLTLVVINIAWIFAVIGSESNFYLLVGINALNLLARYFLYPIIVFSITKFEVLDEKELKKYQRL